MTHKISKFFILAIGALSLSALPALATQACNPSPSGDLDVTTGLTCSMGGLTFTWEQASFQPPEGYDSLGLITPFTSINGDDYDLDFQFSGAPATDILMTYEVSSTSDNITQVDSSFATNGDTTPPSSISETVCGADPALSGGACTDILAQYSNTTGSLTFSSTFGPEQNIWILKDIETGGPSAISAFTDSVVATPEPSAIGLMLMAAFGIAVSARKLRKA